MGIETVAVGVDVVDLRRVERSLARSRDGLASRLCTSEERSWITEGDAAPRTAALFALKEAWIKANGGRPAGFAWSAAARADADASASWITAALDALGVDVRDMCCVGGLPAAWGVRGDNVVALVGGAGVGDVAAASADPARADLVERLSARERADCGTSRPRIAGRVAAKTAAAHLLGDGEIEIRPGTHPAADATPCRGSHPPQVLFDGTPTTVGVTISHVAELAVAVAWRTTA